MPNPDRRALRATLGCDPPKVPKGRCGLGFEIGLLLPALLALRRRRTHPAGIRA